MIDYLFLSLTSRHQHHLSLCPRVQIANMSDKDQPVSSVLWSIARSLQNCMMRLLFLIVQLQSGISQKKTEDSRSKRKLVGVG